MFAEIDLAILRNDIGAYFTALLITLLVFIVLLIVPFIWIGGGIFWLWQKR